MALKILADDPSAEASFCNTRNLSIQAFLSAANRIYYPDILADYWK